MAEMVFINGKIYTLKNDNNLVEAVAIRDGRIVYAGNREDAMKLLDNPVVYDLSGRVLLPGFIESHMHLVEAARTLVEIDLKNVRSIEEFADILHSISITRKKGQWIIGSGWSEMEIFKGIMPGKKDIDEVVEDKPVCLVRQDGHSLVMNSIAVDILKLEDIKDKIPDKVAPREEDGSLKGLFLEDWTFKIMGMIMDLIPDVYFEMAIERANYELVSKGITTINDIMTQYPRMYNIYRKMLRDGRLNVRVKANALGGSKEYEDFMKLEEDEMISKGQVKYFMDGSFGSKTALLYEGYEGEPDIKGIQVIENEELYLIIENSLKNNIQICIHAIGDLAITKILDEYERAFSKYPNRDVRNRIEHIQIIREKDIKRFEELGIVASFQPVFTLEDKLTLTRVGVRRIKDTYRYKSFIDEGITVIFNSDWPFGSEYLKKKDGTAFKGFEPLIGIHCSVNEINLNKNERVEVDEALKCYTTNPAHALFMDKKIGSIECGKFADLIVLDRDPFEVDKMEIKDINVDLTIVAGEVVFERRI